MRKQTKQMTIRTPWWLKWNNHTKTYEPIPARVESIKRLYAKAKE